MTPQQANELLPCPFCGATGTLTTGLPPLDICSFVECPGCKIGTPIVETPDEAIAAWNRRAPAPTEPAVDRDAVIAALKGEIPLVEPVTIGKALRAGREARAVLGGGTGPAACVMLVNIQIASWTYTKETAEAHAKGFNDALKFLRGAVLEVATPTSPAVPTGWQLVPINPTEAMVKAANHYRDCCCDYMVKQTGNGYYRHMLAAAPQVPQASQPTSARHVMEGYQPKPPPPRPQRPAGAPWSDAEREEYRQNMKRGERCPVCSVIEGGSHFPGCSRGK